MPNAKEMLEAPERLVRNHHDAPGSVSSMGERGSYKAKTVVRYHHGVPNNARVAEWI